MTIGKKLYINFGFILGTVLLLLVVNLWVVHRANDAKTASQHALDMKEATSEVRFEMMQNRMHLQNYLLSGDTRDVEKMNDGVKHLGDALGKAQALNLNDQQKANLDKVRQLEQDWSNEFAAPLVDKRRQYCCVNPMTKPLSLRSSSHWFAHSRPSAWASRSRSRPRARFRNPLPR